MIRCILIDDESDSLEVMQLLLEAHCPQVKIEASCSSAEAGIAAINLYKPDVVFLDIEMPNMNGFDMLEKIDELFFEVVFITAYHQFAIKAFQYSALNYLLKPVDADDLIETIQRVEKKRTSPLKAQMDLLMQTLQGGDTIKASRIALTTAEGLVFVATADILFCESDSNYTKVVLKDGKKILVSKPMKEIDDTLSGKDFYRIHNSYLVNLNQISRFVRGEGGYVVMSDGTPISISRTRKQEFVDLFSRF